MAKTPTPTYVVSSKYGVLCTTGRPQGYGRAVDMHSVITNAAHRGLAALVRGARA